jgi:hypothetical protein
MKDDTLHFSRVRHRYHGRIIHKIVGSSQFFYTCIEDLQLLVLVFDFVDFRVESNRDENCVAGTQ